MNHSQVTGVRAAESSDAPQLLTMVEASAESFAFDKETWQRRLTEPGTHTYVVELEQIFGFASAGSAELAEGEGTGEVLGLWIAPEFRRQGWGRKLLVRALGFLKRRGFAFAQVYVEPDSPAIVALLIGLDFKPILATREVNHAQATPVQRGYQVDLKNYF